MPRVLVVEDDIAISNLVSSVLREDGFEVDTAANGAVGFLKVCDSPPSMIVLDLVMPVMDGWEFMRRYRELPECGDTPILVMTAATSRMSDLVGKYELLVKPFDLDGLTEAVTRLTDGPDAPHAHPARLASLADGDWDAPTTLATDMNSNRAYSTGPRPGALWSSRRAREIPPVGDEVIWASTSEATTLRD